MGEVGIDGQLSQQSRFGNSDRNCRLGGSQIAPNRGSLELGQNTRYGE
ncbi:MAG: hypothetical protein F6J93_33565 [Oscillatoria sp. SIO1A7]|nr:hypothetical protein [Oscillatoria sp. SIO1A7]